MAYDFRNLDPTQTPPKGRTIESLTFNGVNLEDEIDEFLTVNVDGRDNYKRKLNVVDTPGDGDFFLNSELEKNVVTVTFFLIAKDTDAFNSAFSRLKYLLQGDEVEFFFEDEQEFTRVGTVTNLTNTEAGNLGVEGKIEITMSDPYRHGQVKKVTGTNSVAINDPQLLYDQNVDKIVVTVGYSTLNNMLLTIGNDYTLRLVKGFVPYSNVVIDINNRTITQNGNSILSAIDITRTNIFEAKIAKGSVIKVDGARGIEVSYRVKLL